MYYKALKVNVADSVTCARRVECVDTLTTEAGRLPTPP